MRCPFCLNEVANFVEETDATGRPLLVCPEPACREQGVPMLYAQNYGQLPALPFSIVGLRGHGKTVFLTSLFHEFDDIGRRWPGFYWAALDEEGMREVRQRLSDLRAGRLPEATNKVFPRALILRMNAVPRVQGTHLMMFDTSGEAFVSVNDIIAYARYVKRSPAIVWLISLENLESPDHLDGFLTVFLQAQAEMKGDPKKQELIVVLTKGDLLLHSERHPDLPESAVDFLQNHELDPRGDSWQVLEEMSKDLRDWLRDGVGYHQFVNRAGDSFAAVRYCVISAQGAAAGQAGLELGLMPRGVLAPLFWLWRQIAPPVWVDTPDGRELFFSLEDALQESPPDSTIYLGPTTYRLKGQLQIRHGIKMIGRGAAKTIVAGNADGYDLAFGAADERFEATDISFLHEGTSAADVFRVVKGEAIFKRCWFNGGIAKTGTSSGDGLILAKDSNALVSECEFARNQGSGVSMRDAARARVERNQCRSNKGSGISCTSSEVCLITQNVCTSNEAHGIRLGAATPARVELNACQANSRSGISCNDECLAEVRKNDCLENGLSGIQIKDEAQPRLEENRCQGNRASGLSFGDQAAGTAARNTLIGNARCGVTLADKSHPSVEENDCRTNGQNGIDATAFAGGVILKNHCWGNDGCGINVEAQASPMVEENECVENQQHGIFIGSTIGRIRLRGNLCKNNHGEQTKDLRKKGWFG
jgi:parallel beta-helix repeat protein